MEALLRQSPPRTFSREFLGRFCGSGPPKAPRPLVLLTWLMLLGLTIVPLFFMPWLLPFEPLIRRGGNESTAEVVSRRETKWVEGKKPVYRIDFRFTTADGREVVATNYIVGTSALAEDLFDGRGAAVGFASLPVRYLAAAPRLALLPDGRLLPASVGVFAFLMIPVAILCASLLLRRERRQVQKTLLRGLPAIARIGKYEEFECGRPQRTIYRAELSFADAAGRRYVFTYLPLERMAPRIARQYHQGLPVVILYRPDSPAKGTLPVAPGEGWILRGGKLTPGDE